MLGEMGVEAEKRLGHSSDFVLWEVRTPAEGTAER
jgi:hypothetical protein